MSITFENLPQDLQQIINTYFPPGRKVREYYLTHVHMVTQLAFDIIARKRELHFDKDFVLYAGILHDAGIIFTNAPGIDCHGTYPYIAHGYLGRELLEKEGFAEIAPVCERHVGVGLTKEEIAEAKLPLPERDMLPLRPEEKLICYADKFYSKSKKHLRHPKSPEEIRKNIARYGVSYLRRWEALEKLFA